MQTLETARNNLTYAATRMTAAHQDLSLTPDQFRAVLDEYLLATSAYHQAIRTINLALLAEGARCGL